jgi:hypothetical protein
LQVAGDELQFFLGGLRLGCCHDCGVVSLEGVCVFFFFLGCFGLARRTR